MRRVEVDEIAKDWTDNPPEFREFLHAILRLIERVEQERYKRTGQCDDLGCEVGA